MNKKGAFLEISAIVMILLTTAGVIYTISSPHRLYVGNTADKTYLEYYKCESAAKSIPEQNIIIFQSKEGPFKTNTRQ